MQETTRRFRTGHQLQRPETSQLTSTLCSQHAEIEYLENELSILADENEELSEKRDFVNTKQDGKTFAPAVREASYCLQNLGVAQHNIGAAMRVVTKAMTGQEVCGSVPSRATQNNFTQEMKVLSRQQMKQILSGAKNTTLKCDGTSKPVGHLVEVQVSTPEQTLLLGLREQVGGKADEYVETITDTMASIEKTPIPTSSEHSECSILANVANTMDDRCATNAAVHRQLETLKEAPISDFKCGMHPLDALKHDCNKVLQNYEKHDELCKKKTAGQYPYSHRGECETQALIRTASKIFHEGQYACGKDFIHHVKSAGIAAGEKENGKSVLYYRFVGNRFHISFLLCGMLYHYRSLDFQCYYEGNGHNGQSADRPVDEDALWQEHS